MEKVKKYIIDNKELMKEWDWEKNNDLNPSQLTYGSEKKAWWICSLNHSYESSIVNKVKSKGCPYCNNKRVLSGYNDLATTNPEILKEWDYDKNIIKPNEISSGSGLSAWWRCSKNHSFSTAIYNKVKGIGCPYCSNRKVLKGFNDLATTNPELLREWDYDKNKFKPDEMISGTDKKVWWKCSKCGHEWQAVIHSRAVGHGCPVCGHEKVGSLNAKIKDQKNSLINKFPNVIKV